MAEQTGTPPADTGTSSTTTETAPAAPAAPAGGGGDERPPKWAEGIYRELVDLRKEVRGKPGGTPPAAAAAAPATQAQAQSDAMAVVEDMRLELAFEKAAGAAKIPDGPLRDLLLAQAKATRPPDLRAWVATYAAAAAPIAPVVVPPITPSDTGPAAASPAASSLPSNPLLWGPDVLGKLTPEEYRAALDKYETKSGRGNPLAEMRRRVEAARKR